MLIPVSLFGGAGTRLWPVCREGRPKPFMKLANGQSLLLKTFKIYLRAANFGHGGEIVNVTNRGHFFMSKDELARFRLGESRLGVFVIEPVGPIALPAVAMASLHVGEKYGRDAKLRVLAANYHVKNEQIFAKAVADAASLAAKDYLVTFSIVPVAPETGFDYIEAGEVTCAGRSVRRFVEKLQQDRVREYFAAGNLIWNSGMFSFKGGFVLDELAAHGPEFFKVCKAFWAEMKDHAGRSDTMLEISAEAFGKVSDMSVDYAIMERSAKVAIVPADIGWSDIGSWSAVRDLTEPDADNNRAFGEAIFVDSTNPYVQSEDRLVAVVGIDNLLVIDTADSLLVAHPDKAQGVKQIVARLKTQDVKRTSCISPSPASEAPIPYSRKACASRSIASRSSTAAATSRRCTTTLANTGSCSVGWPRLSMATWKSSSPRTNSPPSPLVTSTASKTPGRWIWS